MSTPAIPSTYKIPLILLNLAACHKSFKPTNILKQRTEERKAYSTYMPIEIIAYICNRSVVLGNFVLTICEISSILADRFPNVKFLGPFATKSFSGGSGISIHPIFLLGSLLVGGGTFLRMVCYRHLGKYFTFDLRLLQDHRLITDGPYGVVRHPSYTGGIVVIFGLAIAQMGPGSWWEAQNLWKSAIGRVLGGYWVFAIASFVYIMVRRTKFEDDVLRNEFKDQWRAWSIKTPWKLVPWLF